jgi:hypothetical protein
MSNFLSIAILPNPVEETVHQQGQGNQNRWIVGAGNAQRHMLM